MGLTRARDLDTIEAAVHDLRERTLSGFPSELTKLVYLSSTRDYNTGEYQHAGLADRYGADIAGKALAQCHQDAFQELLRCNLSEFVRQLSGYIESTGAQRDKVLDAWRRLQAYRVLIPSDCEPFSAELFVSNIKIGLEALRVGPAPTPAP